MMSVQLRLVSVEGCVCLLQCLWRDVCVCSNVCGGMCVFVAMSVEGVCVFIAFEF